MEYVVLRHRAIPNLGDIKVYRDNGGYEAFRKAVKEMKPEAVTDVVKASGLRGRGGAGFPTGVKWSFIPKDIFPKYVAVNADESEPGTFKDREIIEKNPHQFIEGVLLTCYAVQAERAYIYLRGEFKQPAQILQRAVDDARRAGLIGRKVLGSEFDVDLQLHLGAGAYICGEETALLNSLEGLLGQPRQRPPFPAVQGLYAKPTVINNVETLTNVPPIIMNGADWYKKFGTEKSPGTKVFCLSGRVNRPGNYELPLGTPFRVLVEELGGGIIGGKALKGILPAGASAPILPPTVLDVNMDYESVQAAGSMLGSASIIVMDETVDILWATEKMVRFFRHESCGKCTPCREGTYWLVREMARIRAGGGQPGDIDLLTDITRNMLGGRCFCLLGEFATSSVTSSLKLFRGEYEAATKRNGHERADAPVKAVSKA